MTPLQGVAIPPRLTPFEDKKMINKIRDLTNNANHVEILTRAVLNPTVKSYQLPFMPSAYTLKIVRYDDKSHFLTVPYFEVTKLGALQYDIDYNMKVFAHANFRLGAKIDAVKLAALICDGKILGYNVNGLHEILRISDDVSWIIDVKKRVIAGDVIGCYDVLKSALLFDMVTKDGKLIGVRSRNRELCMTIEATLIECKLNPREYKGFIADLINYAHAQTMARYRVRRVDDSNEIEKIYARKDDDFASCMRGYKAPARIYQTYATKDDKPLQSVALHVLECEGEFIARFLVRLKSNKYSTAYSNIDSNQTESILSAMGYERNCSCMVGARLPLKTDNNNAVFMPYFDGDNKAIHFIDDDVIGQYLQIGGTRGVEIGTATGTNGYAKITSEGYTLGFRMPFGSDTIVDENRYTCECCNGGVDEDDCYHTESGYTYCNECYHDNYVTCEECESEIDRDNSHYMDSVYIARTGRTVELTVCECCANDFWQSPTDGTYFYSNDIG